MGVTVRFNDEVRYFDATPLAYFERYDDRYTFIFKSGVSVTFDMLEPQTMETIDQSVEPVDKTVPPPRRMTFFDKLFGKKDGNEVEQ